MLHDCMCLITDIIMGQVSLSSQSLNIVKNVWWSSRKLWSVWEYLQEAIMVIRLHTLLLTPLPKEKKWTNRRDIAARAASLAFTSVCWSSNSEWLQNKNRMSQPRLSIRVQTIPKATFLSLRLCFCILYGIPEWVCNNTYNELTKWVNLTHYIGSPCPTSPAFTHIGHLVHFRPMCMTSEAAATSTNSKNSQTRCSVWCSTLPNQR